ncbi:DUF4209 domain-containing protein [Novosphingobium humi]|uniref:DUF4209 domain-containing protein n=1 Tax=Novosphingobium humi TaxID=2282397 RepID=A0ABY7U0L8_9SPHN|nr:DUF4209 domain-containing protein [Novosphingobium humi]WCT79081.1 DUF4209 domain-containing protein [Novosphingobium humi]
MNVEPEMSLATSGLVVPASIDAVIADFESRRDAYTAMDVRSALTVARQALETPTEAEHKGAWAEHLAFSLVGNDHHEKPWGTWFGPIGSGTRADGSIVYFPDVTEADAAILDHWKARAMNCTAAVLVARYSDLVWDLGKLLANKNRDVAWGRKAIDAYLEMSGQSGRDVYDAFAKAERALMLAIQIADAERRDATRHILLSLHKAAVISGGPWWRAPDYFQTQSKSGLTADENLQIIGDLEAVLARTSDASASDTFNPHDAERAANMLISYCKRMGEQTRVKALHVTVARTFEHFGSMADAMLASLVLQTSMDAYRQAGMIDDANRILHLVEAANLASTEQMTAHEHSIEIPKKDAEAFLGQIVAGTKEQTFSRLAGNFMLRRAEIEAVLATAAKNFPLSTNIPQTMLQGERIVAQVGSLDDDPVGHLMMQANRHLGLHAPWVHWAVDRACQHHVLTSDDIVQFANRAGLFGDGLLLDKGVKAWLSDDHSKALHILVPQVEAAFRLMMSKLGRPTTKPHPQMKKARMVSTLGELLFQEETAEALGSYGADMVLHLHTLYADPRGHNLRNDLAYGILPVASINSTTCLWVIQTLLLFGLWVERTLAKTDQTDNSGN